MIIELENDTGYLNNVEIIDMETFTWKVVSSMNHKRCRLGGSGVVVMDGHSVSSCAKTTSRFHMVVTGGEGNDDNVHKSCEVYSFHNDSRSQV